jgi:hypothetical protein
LKVTFENYSLGELENYFQTAQTQQKS